MTPVSASIIYLLLTAALPANGPLAVPFLGDSPRVADQQKPVSAAEQTPLQSYSLIIFVTHRGWEPVQTFKTLKECEQADKDHGYKLSSDDSERPNHKCVANPPDYYQLYCSGPTGRGQHGCGGFKTLAGCKAAARTIAKKTSPTVKFECSKEPLCNGCEQFLKGASPEHK